MTESDFRETFAKNLNRLMLGNGENQADIMRLLNVSKSTVSSWATGEKMPRMDKVEAIANHYHVMKSDLLEDHATSGIKKEENLKIALFGGVGDVTDEMWEEAKSYAQYIKEREEKKKEQK